MRQHLLVKKLKEKLGFIENPERKETRRIVGPGVSDRVKKDHIPKGSIQLASPDRFIKSPYFLKFNLRAREVYPEQIQKIQLETGLEYELLVDLCLCSLDADVAKLIFYAYRVAEITADQGTVGLVCDYINLAQKALNVPPGIPEFWTPNRRKYLPYVKKYKLRIQSNRAHAEGQSLRCIDSFLDYLRKDWGV